MTRFTFLFLLFMSISIGTLHPVDFSTTCSLTFPNWDPYFTCNYPNYSSVVPPPLRTLTNASGSTIYDCGITILLDLDDRFTTREDFSNIQMFLKGMIDTCMDRGVGYLVSFYSLFFNSEEPLATCCNPSNCNKVMGMMAPSDYIGHYESTATVQTDTQTTNFTLALTNGLKSLSTDSSKCLYNTVILLSSRIFIPTKEVQHEVETVTNFSCITFTTLAVGNPNITTELMWSWYQNLTDHQYVSTDYNCLPALSSCIKSCGPDNAKDCQEYQDKGNCSTPTTTLATTMTTTASTTPNPAYNDYWHLIYLFALSNRTTSDQFQDVVNYVKLPLQDCFSEGQKILVRFLARNNSDSGWLTDIDAVYSHLESLSVDEIVLAIPHSIDQNDTVTLQLVEWGVSIPFTQNKDVADPMMTLLTDFVSEPFVTASKDDNTLINEMSPFDFQIYCFDAEAAALYQNETFLKKTHVHSDPNFSYDADSLVPICPKQSKSGTSVPTIMIIIIGTCTGAMLILIIATVLYRQKYMWSEKLNRFKTSQQRANEENNDVVDYWELSWDKLVVKNEKLGSGAYGRVYKGKLIGPSPGIEHFYRSEVSNFTDCDCAIKILPPYASENARTEFMHEIHLMKNLGLHDNIVSMLGCVTAGNKTCLVLEFCSSRDLLRYLRHMKTELEISRSMDDQVEFSKEILHLAWQIANGMRYLVDKQIIHRDLAARNILISGLDGTKNAKISDFGLAMSAQPAENQLSASGRLPIKWLALESLTKEQFSFQSDVWSYGIVLFEMYSMGEIPFADIEPTELQAHLLAGNRPKAPLLTPEKVRDLMQRCWEKVPEARPSFQDILGTFSVLLEQATEGYGYLALLKTTEHYRVISEVSDNGTYGNELDEYYADGPVAMRSTAHSGASRSMKPNKKITVANGHSGHVKHEHKPQRKRAMTLQQSSVESRSTTSDRSSDRDSEEEAKEESTPRWRERLRRRKSQLAALNPLRKIRVLARSASPGHDRRRDSDPL